MMSMQAVHFDVIERDPSKTSLMLDGAVAQHPDL